MKLTSSNILEEAVEEAQQMLVEFLVRIRDEEMNVGDDLTDEEFEMLALLLDYGFVWVTSDDRVLLTSAGELATTKKES